MRRVPLWSVALVLLGLAALTIAQGYQPDVLRLGDLARMSDLRVLTPTAYWVSGAGSDTNICTQAEPCRTFQHVCDLVPVDICDAVTLTATADYTGAGCRKTVRFCDHPAGDGGVTEGSLLITGTLADYAPADGGTGKGSFASAAAGSSCTLDSWTVSGGAYNTNELQNKLIGVTSGTGSGKDRLWPIFGNDAGVIQPESFGDATQPAASSGYQVYQASGSSNINANLGQVVAKGGPGAAQGTNAAAFEISTSGNTLSNGAGDDRRVTIQHFNVTGGSTVLAIGTGTISIRENFCAGGTCWRSAPGASIIALERNVDSASIFALAANTSIGAEFPLIQMYNNLGTSAATTALRIESAATIYSRGNYFPNGLVRLSSCRNCVARCDTYDAIRGGAAGLQDSNPGQAGGIPLDGVQLVNNSGSTYTLSLSNGFGVAIDQNGGPASTITAAAGGHIAAVGRKAELNWAATTTFNGAGTLDMCPPNSTECIAVAAIRARPQRSLSPDLDGPRMWESGGLIGAWEPLLELGTGRDEQCGSSTLTVLTKTVTFTTAFATAPDFCECDDTGGTAAVCSWTGTSTTTTANFIGVSTGGTFAWCCKAKKQ